VHEAGHRFFRWGTGKIRIGVAAFLSVDAQTLCVQKLSKFLIPKLVLFIIKVIPISGEHPYVPTLGEPT